MNGYKLTIHTQYCLGRFGTKYSRAQKYLDNEVLKDDDPFVPFRSGNLRNSGITGTSIGSGKVMYNAPYAKPAYYAMHWHFSKDKHPQACAQWFEKAKAVKKYAWINGVDAIMKGD